MSDLVPKKMTPEEIAEFNARLEALKEEELKSEYADLSRDLAQQRIHVKSMRKVTGTDSIIATILYHQRTRNYYKSAMPIPGQRPDCHSPNGVTGYGDNGQPGKVHTCVDCPLSEWGSSTKGEGKGQACRQMRFAAIHRIEPRNDATPQVEIMQISPTNLRSFANFMEEFIKRRELFYTYKVAIHLLTNNNDEGIGFAFEIGDKLTPEEQVVAVQLHAKEKANMQKFLDQASATGMLDSGDDKGPDRKPQLQG